MLIKRLLRKFSTRFTGTIVGINTNEHVAALTFDDGPDPEFTPKLLEVLEHHKTKATFFMLGTQANKFPGLVDDVAKRGHAIGNHSWDHLSFPMLNHVERFKQITKCSKALAPHSHKIFRPPFGHQNLASRFDALLLGYNVVGWNILAEDWLDHDAQHTLKKLSQQLQPGSIILLHDSLYNALQPEYYNRDATVTAVDLFLQSQTDKYKFLTIPDLLTKGPVNRHPWFLKADLEWLKTLGTKYEKFYED